MIQFTVPGNPIAQARPRFARIGKFVRTYDPKESVDFKSKVAVFARDSGLILMNGVICLSVDLYLKRPKAKYLKKYSDDAIVCDKRPDVDNFAKGIMDALNGIAWRDDGQVHSIRVTKWYHEKNRSPRTDITIEELKGY